MSSVDTGPGNQMASEIAEQPVALAGLLRQAAEIREVAAVIRRRAPRFVLFAGRGTSDHAALYGKYLVEIGWGAPAGLVSPSAMTVYGTRPDLTGALWVAVSQSGASPDLAESTAVARRCGAVTVAVTNDGGSELARAAELTVPLGVGPERAVAATKTYTASLLALYLLLSTAADPEAAAAGLPDAAAATLDDVDQVVTAAVRYRFADRMVTTGRGYSYPTAREAALKLMETSYLAAHAFSPADLLHGPVAMLDAGVPVIAVVPRSRGGQAAAAVVERLRGTGADVLVLGTTGDPGGLRVAAGGVPEELLPVLEILPLQQLAWRLAVDRGTDPDRPRGLSKVTRTR